VPAGFAAGLPAVVTCARVELRAHWRAIVGLALLAGLFGGAVIGAAAGARRTDSAYGRLLRATNAPDVIVFAPPAGQSRTFASLAPQSIAGLPHVAQAGVIASFSVVRPSDVSITAPLDDRVPYELFGRKMLAGREPRSDRADEVAISFVLAREHHLGVGDRLELDSAANDGTPRHLSLRVVGIDAAAAEFPPQTGSGVDLAWATPAFYRANAATLAFYRGTVVRLEHGARDLAAFNAGVDRLAGGRPVQSWPLAFQAANTEHSIHLQAVALWLLAGLLGVTGALVLAQLVARQAALDSADHPVLGALGMTRAQVSAVTALRAAVLAGAAAAVAVVVAYLVSPLLPLGLARDAEPHPGFALDAAVVGLGALVTASVVAVASVLPAWRAARALGRAAADREAPASPSAVAGAIGRSSAPVPVVTGVRMALEPGRGRSAVPVRTTVVGAVLAVAALAAALVFGSSLDHLLGNPTLYGVTWDAQVQALSSSDITPALPAVTGDRRVADISVGYTGFPVDVGPVRLEGLALRAVRGDALLPAPVEGRAPERADEVMLGTRTLKELHTHVGATITAMLADTGARRAYRVVGSGVFPTLDDALSLGRGVAVTVDALTASLPKGVPTPPFDHAVVRLAPGVDKAPALADLARAVAPFGDTVEAPEKPVDLVNFGRVEQLPLVLAALVGALAAATLAHLLITSVRRRRRELALLKTLGLVPRQVRWAVASQASTLALGALIVGVPAGVAAGRWGWTIFGHQLGILPAPSVGLARLVLLAAGTLAVANAVALVPARAAARTPPAAVLRAE